MKPTTQTRHFTPPADYVRAQQDVLDLYNAKATSQLIELEGSNLRAHVLTAGAGKPLVYLHGGDGEAWNWAPLVAELQNFCKVVGVDRPGFGMTDRFDYESVDLRAHASDFVVRLLDTLNLDTATLAGGSMGGFFALAAALDHPERIERLVLLGMPVGLEGEAPPSLVELCTVPGLAEQFMERISTIDGLRWQYREMFNIDPDTVPEQFFAARAQAVNLESGKESWAKILRLLCDENGIRPGLDLRSELGNLRMPVLSIWGDHDMTPVEVGLTATKQMPKGEFVCLPGVGHFPFFEAPRKVAAHIRDFMSR